MEINTTTTYLLTKVTNLFRSELEKELRGIGLHSGQVFILFELWEKDGASQIELARQLNLSSPTIYKMVKSLEKNNFIKCSACKKDGRIMRVYLTEKGSYHQILVQTKWQNFENTFFTGLNETEQLMFFQLLGKIKDSFS